MPSMMLQLPDGTGDTETVLRECQDEIIRRQGYVRQQIAATLQHTLQGKQYEDQEVISALDCVASSAAANAAQDLEEVDRSTSQQAGTLAESIRMLISRTADERLELVNDRLIETQAAFEEALQNLQFVNAAYCLHQLRREVEDEKSAYGVQPSGVLHGVTRADDRVSCGPLHHAGAEGMHEIIIKANEWLESMEGYLKERLVTAVWSYYVFLQTGDEMDWAQPLVTVYQGLADSRLWDAAKTSGCLDSVAQSLSSALIQYAVVPLLRIQSPLQLVASTYHDEHHQADYARLQATQQEESQGSATAAWVFPCCADLLSFLHKEVFAGDLDITHCFMAHFWPQCCTQGSDVLAHLAGNPQELQTCIEAARNAESSLHQAGLLSAQGPDSKAMSTAVAAQEGMLYQHLQGDSVLQLRAACAGAVEWPDKTDECLVSVNSALVVTEDGAERCSGSDGSNSTVWAAAVRIGDIVEDPLVTLSPDASVLHVRAACKTLQDAVVMFGVLVIRSWRPDQGLRRALIHLNSSRYLIARINLLPALLQLETALRMEVLSSCIDAARRCAAFAAPIEQHTVEEQCRQAMSLVQELPPLQQLDGNRGKSAKRQVQKSVGQLQKLSESLTAVCSNSGQSEFMAAVLGPCCGLLVDRVLALSDIGEQDSEIISTLCDMLWKEVVQTVSLNATADFVDASEHEVSTMTDAEEFVESIMEFCIEGRRLRAVAELLRVRMAEVVQSWGKGKYRVAGLTAPEVQGVVRAVFEDNDFRASCLQEIRAS